MFCIDIVGMRVGSCRGWGESDFVRSIGGCWSPTVKIAPVGGLGSFVLSSFVFLFVGSFVFFFFCCLGVFSLFASCFFNLFLGGSSVFSSSSGCWYSCSNFFMSSSVPVNKIKDSNVCLKNRSLHMHKLMLVSVQIL